MPATSKSQQHLFGMAYAYSRGELDDAPGIAKRLASQMSRSQLRDFAATKTKGLPKKKRKKRHARKRAVEWAGDVQREFLADRKYPNAYAKDEIGEFLDEIKKRDLHGIKDEFGDAMYGSQMALHNATGMNFPMIGVSGSLKKFRRRNAIWKQIFDELGVPFHVDHLKGGSNFARPEKVKRILASAGVDVSDEEAARISREAVARWESDEEIPYSVGHMPEYSGRKTAGAISGWGTVPPRIKRAGLGQGAVAASVMSVMDEDEARRKKRRERRRKRRRKERRKRNGGSKASGKR